MRIAALSVKDFRNLALVRLRFGAGAVFFLGRNGQGKTSLLEAVGLISALRSFRTSDRKALVRWERPEARVIVELIHERLGESTLELQLSATRRRVLLDGEPLRRLSDLLGKFPTVVLASDDAQLVRGGPGVRRQFLDLLLASTDAIYYGALQRYAKAQRERNALLREGGSRAERHAYERILAESGAELIVKRMHAVAELAAAVSSTYEALSGGGEKPVLRYRPDLIGSEEELRQQWEADAHRDEALGQTRRGPHRDHLDLGLKGHGARAFASEGQQRGLALALRLAQARWFEARTSARPVLLADDVLGELDPARRERFWAALDPAWQLFATGTREPDASPGRTWELVRVENGAVEYSPRRS